ncbi:MAG: APC family permease [Firmicutes bacterium]|nr:APC family permease [Bacillota bacterium]
MIHSQTKPPQQLAKAVGVLAIMASAVAQEYGSGINFVAPQSIGVYPGIENLVPLAMFVTGLLYLPKVFLFMRFGTVMPRAGGSYTWITRSLGMPIGFIVHFLWWASLAFSMGVLAFAFGSFLSSGLISAGWPQAAALSTDSGHIILGTAIIWTMFWLHHRGIRNYSVLVSVLLGAVVLSSLLVITIGLGSSPHAFLAAAHAKLHVTFTAPRHLKPPHAAAFLSVCTLFIFAYGGLSAAPFLGGEAKNRHHTIPLGILGGWAVAIVLFTLVTWAVFHAVPWWSTLTLLHHGDSAYTTTPGLVGLLSSPMLAVLLNLLMAAIVGKTIAPQMLGTSRLVFAWAQDHVFPARFARLSRHQTPTAALFLSALIGNVSLIQSTLVGWSIGVTFRSISILFVLFLLGLGVFNLKWGAAFRQKPWACAISRGPVVLIAATFGMIIAAVLISSVLIVPHTLWIFQPAVQSAITLIIGAILYRRAAHHARLTGWDLKKAAEALPED